MLDLILASGSIGVAIAALFVVAAYVVIERMIFIARVSTDMNRFSDEFQSALDEGNLVRAKAVCDKYQGHIPEVYRIALEHRGRGPATLRTILQNHIDLTVVPRLRFGLGFLSTIGKAAPMLGLIGTVWGMIGAFSTIASASGEGVDPKALAGDIGMALGTTFLGLLVAIPVVFAVTFLRAKVEKLEIDLDRYSQKCLDLLFPSQPPSLAETSSRS